MHRLWFHLFLSGLGKATFLKHFFAIATFISSGDSPDTLANTALIGDRYKVPTVGRDSVLQQICQSIWIFLSSYTLSPVPNMWKYHPAAASKLDKQYSPKYLRAYNIWTLEYSFQRDPAIAFGVIMLCYTYVATSQHALTNYGWQLDGNSDLRITWDSPSNIQEIRSRVQQLQQGCKCTTGCTTARCSCNKQNKTCNEGCQCRCCANCRHYKDSTDTSTSQLSVVELEEIAETVIGGWRI